jgi:hypothetical protein
MFQTAVSSSVTISSRSTQGDFESDSNGLFEFDAFGDGLLNIQ